MSKIIGVAFDVETTGLDETVAEVIELGAVVFNEDFEEVFSFSSYVKPEKEYAISQEAMDVNGLSLDFLRKQPRASVVRSVFNEWLESIWSFNSRDDRLLFLAHRADFDKRFITSLFSRAWYDKHFRVELCSKAQAEGRKLKYKLDSSTHLGDLLSDLCITVTGKPHSALRDARASLAVYKTILHIDDELRSNLFNKK